MITMCDENGKFHLDSKDKAILQKCVYEKPYLPFNPNQTLDQWEVVL